MQREIELAFWAGVVMQDRLGELIAGGKGTMEDVVERVVDDAESLVQQAAQRNGPIVLALQLVDEEIIRRKHNEPKRPLVVFVNHGKGEVV